MEDRDSNSNRDRAYITISNIIQDVAGSYKVKVTNIFFLE